MATGVQHLRASLVLNVGMSFIAYEAYTNQQVDVLQGIVIGAIGGMLITPDYDLEGVTETERIIRKIPFFGEMWIMLWYPYALWNEHRGRSHTIIGTLERQVYLVLVIIISLLFLTGCQYVFLNAVTIPKTVITNLEFLPSLKVSGIAFLTWFCHDVIHMIMDKG